MTALACPRVAVALVPVGLLLSVGCSRDNTHDTGIIVEVSSDLGVSTDIDEVQLTATDPQGNSLYQNTFDLVKGPNLVKLPFRVGLFPFHDTTTPIHIVAAGQLSTSTDSQPIVSRSATLSFINDEKVVLPLPLLAVCKKVVCSDASKTCKASGNCEPDTIKSSSLPAYVPNQPIPGADAATVIPDAATSNVAVDGAANTAADGALNSATDAAGGRDAFAATGGAGGTGGPSGTGAAIGTGGGTAAAGGMTASGGTMSTGGTGNGGVASTVPSTGGTTTAGGTTASGGPTSSGGTTTTGGTIVSSGTTSGGGAMTTGGTTASGGTTSVGGSTTAGGTTASSGTGSGGSGSSGANPPGYYMTEDWNVTSVDWHGCVWTAIDSLTNSNTSISPQDFMSGTPEGGPYRVSGTLFNDYNSFAMVGFALNEAVTGSSTQCQYNPDAASLPESPAATVPSSATGIAISWSEARIPSTAFRIFIQAVGGATNAADRWCATIADTGGPSFVRFTDFYTQCWYVGTAISPGTQYAGEPINAVAFQVPGTLFGNVLFDFTISGFAPGTSAADAPGQ
jgi:hypothetical protein